MAWPPPVMPTNRTNTTVMTTTHPAEHNAVNLAINDIVTKVQTLNVAWEGAYTGAAFGVTTTAGAYGALTFTAPFAGTYAVWVQANFYHSAGAGTNFFLFAAVDGVAVNAVGAVDYSPTAPGQRNMSDNGLIDLTAGPHTVQAQVAIGAAGATVVANKFTGLVMAVTKGA